MFSVLNVQVNALNWQLILGLRSESIFQYLASDTLTNISEHLSCFHIFTIYHLWPGETEILVDLSISHQLRWLSSVVSKVLISIISLHHILNITNLIALFCSWNYIMPAAQIGIKKDAVLANWLVNKVNKKFLDKRNLENKNLDCWFPLD